MTQITRTYTFTDGTTAYGSQVETEFGIVATAINNLDAGTATWANVKSSLFLAANGSVSAPSYAFTGDATKGMYSGGSNILQFATSGTAGPLIDGSQCFQLVDGAESAPSLRFQNASGTGIYKSSTNELSISTASTRRVKVDANGNLYVTTNGGDLGVISSYNSISMNSIGTLVNSITVQNSKTFTVTCSSLKCFLIQASNGDSALVNTNFTTGTITITGTGGAIIASAAPGASQLGISKSSSSHVISFTSGSSLASTVLSIQIMFLGNPPTAATNWA